MARAPFLIPDIILYDVVGAPRESAGILFVPALFERVRDLPRLMPEQPLQDVQDAEQRLAALRKFATTYDGDLDALHLPWVRGRINAVFGLSVPTGIAFAREEILDVPFLAIERQTDGFFRAVPLICVDGWGRDPALLFVGTAEHLTKQRIASAFWELLLQGITDISPFAIDVDELETYDKHIWSFERGQFFLQRWGEGEDDYPDELWLPEESRPCPECEGTGEESFLPAGAPCEMCCGRGYLR